jgi:uncharacterized protein YcaQ
MTKSGNIYPLPAVRALALHTQGLTSPQAKQLALGTSLDGDTCLEAIYNVIANLGCVQIDTLQMVHRSHYLVLWSRLGTYDPKNFDCMIYDPENRCLFEGWQHAASIIPMEAYRMQMPHQRRLREDPSNWYKEWYSESENAELVPFVMERIREEGALRAKDFEYQGPKRGSWWDWKPTKVALEYNYAFGNLMITNRINFQRVYDLTERVLPDWVDKTEPSLEERDRYWIEMAVRALGICQPGQAADYVHMKRGRVRPFIETLVDEGIFIPVEAELNDGQVQTLIVHCDNIPYLEQAADGGITPERTTFLSPFDSLFWARRRDEQVWNFHQVLEAYKPASKRVWGYFCLPILHRDRLVGRFDPKLERQNGTLRLKALYLESGVQPDGDLVTGVASALKDFMTFHQATDLVIEKSQPDEFGEKLMASL